jgi:hypothetical protein
VADISDFFIIMSVETTGLITPTDVPTPPTVGSLDGVITQFVGAHVGLCQILTKVPRPIKENV